MIDFSTQLHTAHTTHLHAKIVSRHVYVRRTYVYNPFISKYYMYYKLRWVVVIGQAYRQVTQLSHYFVDTVLLYTSSCIELQLFQVLFGLGHSNVHDNINNRADWVICIAILRISPNSNVTLFDPSKRCSKRYSKRSVTLLINTPNIRSMSKSGNIWWERC